MSGIVINIMTSPVRSFIDGIPFKIADRYVKPTIVSAPHATSSEAFNRMMATLQYPFTTERQVLEWTDLERQAMAEQAAAEEQHRAEEATSCENTSQPADGDLQSDADTANAGDASPGTRTLISRQHSIFARLGKDILTPTPITSNPKPKSESSEPTTQINPFDFEAERDPFESVTLQTIDVKAELADVFSQATTVATSSGEVSPSSHDVATTTPNSPSVSSQPDTTTAVSVVSQTSDHSNIASQHPELSKVVPSPEAVVPNTTTAPLVFTSDSSVPADQPAPIAANPLNGSLSSQIAPAQVIVSSSLATDTSPQPLTQNHIHNSSDTSIKNKGNKPAVAQKPVVSKILNTTSAGASASCTSINVTTKTQPPLNVSQTNRTGKPAGAVATPFALVAGTQMTSILQDRAKANTSNSASKADYENINKQFEPVVNRNARKGVKQRFSNPVYDEVIPSKPLSETLASSSKSTVLGRPLPPIPPRPGDRPKSVPIKVKGRSISDVGDLLTSDQESTVPSDTKPSETANVNMNNATVSWRKPAPPMPAPPPAGQNTGPAVSTRSRLPDPFDSLNSDGKNIVRDMKGMGFPGPQAARIVERIGSDEQKVLDQLLRIGHLMEKTEHTSDQVELAVSAYPELEDDKVDSFIEQCIQLQQLGFEYVAVQKALFEANQDRDKALEDLLTSV